MRHYGAAPATVDWEWDMPMLQDALALTSEAEISWCYGEKWRNQDLSWVQGRIGSVTRKQRGR